MSERERIARIVDPAAFGSGAVSALTPHADSPATQTRREVAFRRADTILAALSATQQPVWQPIETAPMDGTRVMVYFAGAGPIVAFRNGDDPDLWTRYLGFGKSTYQPAVHADLAMFWMPLPPAPDAIEAEQGEKEHG